MFLHPTDLALLVCVLTILTVEVYTWHCALFHNYTLQILQSVLQYVSVVCIKGSCHVKFIILSITTYHHVITTIK